MKKSTWIIIALVGVLGLVYIATKQEKVSVGVLKLQLPSFQQQHIDRIEISGKEPLTLIKQDDVWFLELATGDKIRRVKADDAAISAMLLAAAALSPSYYVTQLEEKQAELGLSPDAATTIKLYAKGPQVWSLVIGKSDQKAGRYAKLVDEKHIYAVRGSYSQIIRPKIEDWREHRIVSLSEADIDSIDLERDAKTSLALKRAEENNWALDTSKFSLSSSFRAEQASLASLVRSIANLRASAFIDEHKDLPAPRATLSLKTKDQKEQRLEFYPGPGDNYWIKSSESGQIFVVGKNAIDRLFKPIEDLRAMSFMSLDNKTVNKIRLFSPKSRVILEKSDNTWKITEPVKMPKDFEFDPGAADNLISIVMDLRADRLATSKDKASNVNWQKTPLVEFSDKEGKLTSLYATKSKTNAKEYLVKGNILLEKGLDAFKKEEFELPPLDENTKGFESLPVDVQRKLLDAAKHRQ